MQEVLLMRFGEVHLKGLNRPYFMRVLLHRIRESLQTVGGHVWMAESRIYVRDSSDMAEALTRLCRVFGVHSVSPALEMDKDMDLIRKSAIGMMRGKKGTFKVFAKRSDKRFALDSPEICQEIGGDVLEACPDLTVAMRNPDHKLYVEIRDNAYVYADSYPAVGGLPMGTNGKAALLLSGGIDSPVAGFKIARRGVHLCCVHFHSFPYTSEQAKEKVLELARLLARYHGSVTVYCVPFTEIQQALYKDCEESYLTVLMRRYMMRLAERIAKKHGAKALITGESVGQVASQTMDSLYCTDSVVDMPIFRPLIGDDKIDIMRLAEEIGTYETSILPFEDCCTIFTPKHPATKPRIDICEREEEKIDGEAMMERALNGVETILCEAE